MKQFSRYGVLPLCALALVALAGCSRNVGTDATGSAVSQNPAPSASVAPPAPSPAEPEQAPAKATPIKWERTFESALKKARETQKPIMIDFYATWCGPCKILDSQIYPAPEVTREAQNFVSLKVDVDQQQQLAAKFEVRSLPTILFLDATGKVIHREEGITGQVSDFLNTMQTARAQVAPTSA